MKLIASTLLCSLIAAQTPTADPKPAPVPAPAPKVEPAPAKQEPVTQDPTKQDPAKKEQGKPAGESPKGDSKTDKTDKNGKKDEARVDKPPADQPVPKGTDPADIAAMRSAEQMIEAEKKLGAEIKAGKVTGLDKVLPFDEIDSWPYEDGLKGMPKRVKELSGKKVLMVGFMLPIDEVQHIKEFLLVKSMWSCCYGQPPDINGIVRVVMPKGKTADFFFDPIKIVGTFKIESTVMDGYVVDIYQLHVESLEALK
jgi:hypothetical protein